MAYKPHYNAEGKRIPGVTTIIGARKDAGGLMHWAWKLGTEGKNYRDESKKAASAGTLAHSLIEHELVGTPYPDTEDYSDEEIGWATRAYENFLKWQSTTKLVIEYSEVQLACEELQFGGTMDAVSVGGNRCVVDWKTSNSFSSDHLYQLAAYGHLWNTNNPEDPITGGYHILRVSREYGDFEHRYFDDLSTQLEGFMLMRRLYDIDKATKRRAK